MWSLKKTYNEILDAMKLAYYETSGRKVDGINDISLRFQAVASELYSLSCNADFVLKQAFPQTATGKYLNMHASLRGMERKSASKAQVQLTFSISEPSNGRIIIPMGTICACANKPYIQFETISIGIINVGKTSVTVYGLALGTGGEYNVDEGSITRIINPPAGIEFVINNFPSSGGIDDESDDELRERLCSSFSVPSTGVTLESIENTLNQIDEVRKTRVLCNGSKVDIYVQTENNVLSSEVRRNVENSLYCLNLLDLDYEIDGVIVYTLLFTVKCELDSSTNSSTIDSIKQVIKNKISASPIGEPIDLNEIAYYCNKIDGVNNAVLDSPSAINQIIPLCNNECVAVGDIEVKQYE